MLQVICLCRYHITNDMQIGSHLAHEPSRVSQVKCSLITEIGPIVMANKFYIVQAIYPVLAHKPSQAGSEGGWTRRCCPNDEWAKFDD